MGTTRDKIVFFVLNYIALEGAKDRFGVSLPADNPEFENLYEQIKKIGFPETWSRAQLIYEATPITGSTKCEKCWCCLEVIRNNLFHANKAFKPDPHKRLEDLLGWSVLFIGELIKTDHDIGKKAAEIKKVLNI